MKVYYPSINLLRGIAALLVCLFHFIGHVDYRGTLFSPDSMMVTLGKLGANGVYIFFVISGFVIPLSLWNANFKLKQLPRFLLRRFIRIEIPYIVSILLILLVGILFALKSHSGYSFNTRQFIYHILYVIPFSSFEWYNVIYWTLAIEFQFYIVIGILFFFLFTHYKTSLYIALLVFGMLNVIGHDNRLVFQYSTIFLQGILLFLIKTNRMNAKIGTLLIGVCVVTTAYLHSIDISIATALTALCIHSIEVNHKRVNQFGDISYSLYLTHGLIGGHLLYFFSPHFPIFSARVVLVIVALIASFLFSYLFWKFIENPSRQLSKKITVAPLEGTTNP